MTETGLSLLTDATYKEFIQEGRTVVIVSLLLNGGVECPYCIKLKAKAETLTHRKIGTLVINDNSAFKKEYFKTIESGKSFPVTIVFENGVELYRRAGDIAIEVLEDFIDNGTQAVKPQQRGGNADLLTITELKAALYDEILVLNRTQSNINVLEESLRKKNEEFNQAAIRG